MMDITFTRLLWKDALMVRSLVLIAAGMIVIGFLGIEFAHRWEPIDSNDQQALLVLVWFASPFVVAFGVPALLIGSEQESGTISWLRTLPISRGKVIYSKLLVGFTAVMLTWLISTIAAFNLSVFSLLLDRGGGGDAWIVPLMATAMVSIVLLLVGFALSYWLKSPIAVLILVLPTFVLIISMLAVSAEWFESFMQVNQATPNWISYCAPGIPIVFAICLFGLLHHVLALRCLRPTFSATCSDSHKSSLAKFIRFSRLRDDRSNGISVQIRVPKLFNDRVKSLEGLQSRPAPFFALLWQAASQQARPVFAILGLFFALWICLFRIDFLEYDLKTFVLVNSAFPLAYLGMSLLGSLTFYFDALHRRHLFFAERGISPKLVWLSRFALPATALVIAVIITLSLSSLVDEKRSWISFHIVGFGFSALAVLVANRPILGLIASPLFVLFLFGSATGLLENITGTNFFSDAYLWSLLLVAVASLIGTWRFLPHWLEGSSGIGIRLKVCGYAAICFLVVVVGNIVCEPAIVIIRNLLS
jgi:ABC-type transport system involved in multi-copper enzyme maturation permease subunit